METSIALKSLPTRSEWNRISLILALSLGIKLAFALNVDDLVPRNDERAYIELAAGILDGEGYTSLFRPPLHPALIAAVAKSGGTLSTVRLVQVALSTLTVLLVWLVARRWLSSRAALLAASLVAFDPVLIAFSHLFWTETLFLFLFWSMTALLLPFDLESRWRWPLGGLVLGLTGLTRPVVLTAAPLLVAWIFYREWRAGDAAPGLRRYLPALRATTLLAVGACLVVLPWTIRNYQHTGSVVLVDTNGAFNVLIGTEPAAMFLDKDDTWSPHWARLGGEHYGTVAARDPGYAQSRALSVAAQNVFADPLRYLGACFFEGSQLWTLDSFPLRHLRNGWYGSDVAGWVIPAMVCLSALFGILILGGGFLGLGLLPASSMRGWIWLFLAHSALLHTLLFSLSRFQVPLRPMMAISAAYFLMQPRQSLALLWSSGLPSLRAGFVILAILLLAVVWSRDFPMLVDMIRTGGEAFRFVRRLDGP